MRCSADCRRAGSRISRWSVRPGDNGLVVRSDDVASLRDALAETLRDRAMLRRMGRASLRLASTVHAPEAYVAGLLAVVRGGAGAGPRIPEAASRPTP